MDTGSRLDDVFYEEFKGTGTWITSGAPIAGKADLPAIDIERSSTRRDDLLLSPDCSKECGFFENVYQMTTPPPHGAGMVFPLPVRQFYSACPKSKNNVEFLKLTEDSEKKLRSKKQRSTNNNWLSPFYGICSFEVALLVVISIQFFAPAKSMNTAAANLSKRHNRLVLTCQQNCLRMKIKIKKIL